MKELLRILCLVSLSSIFALFIGGCGGGGGGGDGSVTASSDDNGIAYIGLTSQASIDENNAQQLTGESYEGGKLASSLASLGAVSVESQDHLGRPRVFEFSQTMENALRSIDLTSRAGGTFAGAVYHTSGTIYGDCGGGVFYDIDVDDQTGRFSGNMNFNSYCNDNVTIDGQVQFSSRIALTTGKLVTFSFSFDNLRGTSEQTTTRMAGDISFDASTSPEVVTANLRMAVDSQVYQVTDYTLHITDRTGYIEVSFTGRFYDPGYGYVDISTPEVFIINDGYENPSSGVLLIQGRNGTQARLTAHSVGYCEVQADTDGDGVMEWDSGWIPWSDLYS
ncbi:MAG: hypothetical protein JRI36_09660 [Deltaproteobacteria bacterium]|nr:hypothetical protein [Deltaproteobacteria bacterium]